MITETWFNTVNNSSTILDNKFSCYRSDRDLKKANKKTGGGVIILVKNNIPSSLLYIHQGIYETVCIMIRLHNINIIISALYMPPLYDINLYVDYLNRLQSELLKHNNCKLIILGDFNIPGFKFNEFKNEIKLFGCHSDNNIKTIAKVLSH